MGIRARRPDAVPDAGALPERLRFLTAAALPELFTFPPDMARVPVEPNRLNTQVLVRYYDTGMAGSESVKADLKVRPQADFLGPAKAGHYIPLKFARATRVARAP